nr:PKD domain-containing protein [Micromonospora sp. DSM 115978]
FANLPTLFHTAVPTAFAFDVTEPVPATISAVPRYHWDFGDGETGPDAPGLPYDPAISPRDHPEAYVSHGYPEPGTYEVTLTVTWFGSFTVPGVAEAFPLEAVVLAATDELVVQESAGVLTGND